MIEYAIYWFIVARYSAPIFNQLITTSTTTTNQPNKHAAIWNRRLHKSYLPRPTLQVKGEYICMRALAPSWAPAAHQWTLWTLNCEHQQINESTCYSVCVYISETNVYNETSDWSATLYDVTSVILATFCESENHMISWLALSCGVRTLQKAIEKGRR